MTNNNNYKLKSLDIRFQDYGEYKGKYMGKIAFENNQNEAFMFNLSPEETDKYLQLISEKMVGSASHLAENLLQSMNLLPMSDKHAAIEEATISTTTT